MPVAVSETRLAASVGSDPKRARARRSVALDFFTEHIFAPDPEKDWSVVQKAMQCIDVSRPVKIGPEPPAPRRLIALPQAGPLGAGFFADEPSPREDRMDWYVIAPEAVYLKYFSPSVRVARARTLPPARYFIPGARTAKGPRVATKERT